MCRRKMSQRITELVDEPELVDAADDITIDRWTKYGHDRLYINGARVEPYIDLEDGSLGDTGMVRVDAEFDGDRVTVEIGDEDGHSRHDVIVISLSGDVDDDDEESEGELDADTDDDSTDEMVTAEVPDAVPYNSQTAGMAQQINAQRLFEVGDGDVDYEDAPDRDADGNFDYVCPHCGGDANNSTEKPYCSKECATADLEEGARV